jgi:hypothetical protein
MKNDFNYDLLLQEKDMFIMPPLFGRIRILDLGKNMVGSGSGIKKIV